MQKKYRVSLSQDALLMAWAMTESIQVQGQAIDVVSELRDALRGHVERIREVTQETSEETPEVAAA